MKESVETLFNETLRPITLKNQVTLLVGEADAPGSMLNQLTGLMQQIVKYPDAKIKTILPTAKLGFNNNAEHTQLD